METKVIPKVLSGRLEAAMLNSKSSRLGSFTKLYESAINLLIHVNEKGSKKEADFAQKEVEKWSNKIEDLLPSNQ